MDTITLEIKDKDINDEVVQRAACKVEVSDNSKNAISALFEDENSAPKYVWVLKEGISDADKKYLLRKYSKERASKIEKGAKEWEEILGEDLNVLRMLPLIKKYGIPENEDYQQKIFDFFRDVLFAYHIKNRCPESPLLSQYPPDYDTLCSYSEEFDYSWGTLKLLELTDRAAIPYDDGNIVSLIDESNKLNKAEKSFLKYIFYEER